MCLPTPGGECLLARIDDQPVGILMMKERGSTVCEMNRMFVRNSVRRQGVAQTLVAQLFISARRMGYKRLMLSALYKHCESLPLYRKMGFADDDRPPDSGDDEHEVRLVCTL